MFKRSTTSECGVTQHTTTTIQYERYNTDGAKICSRKQRTKYDRRYDEEANRARRRGSVSGKPERHTRENFHTHYDSSPLTFGRHEEPMRNLFCTRNKKIETRRKISQSATICRIFLGGKLARSRSSSSSTPANFKGNNKNKKDIRNEVAVVSLPILRGQPLFQELSRSMVDLLVHEEHACSFFTHYLTSHSRTTCPQIYVYHTRPRRPPQHIQCPSSP